MDAFFSDKLRQIIALLMVEGVGDKIARNLISYCGSPEAVFREKRAALEKIPDIGAVTARSIRAFREFDRAELECEFIRKNQIRPLCYLNEDYPKRLKHCPDSPVLLYYKGTADPDAPRMVALVGTRNATTYGKEHTLALVEGLAEMKVTIVSGLAYGIDICAHRAALKESTPTIGVLAHGLDRIYPGDHRSVAAKMLDHGGLITEHRSGTIPDRENFPKRNRIIAGLCDAILVVEAARKGGALITADIANSYNRDVFAIPGRTGDPFSEGCNHLIKSHRAALITSAEDIRYVMQWDDDAKKSGKGALQRQLFTDLDPDEQHVVKLLDQDGKTPIDELTIKACRTHSQVAGVLLTLELKGVIRVLPGKIYELV
jgi:DNA processing protein